MSQSQIVPVSARFWLGTALPTVLLAMFIALVLLTGAGKREAPMILFFAALIAVPGVMLLNCWVLFVNWASRSRLLAGAAALPLLVAAGSLLLVHGTGRWQEAGMLVMLPFLAVPMNYPRVVAALWLVIIAAALVVARRVAARRELP